MAIWQLAAFLVDDSLTLPGFIQVVQAFLENWSSILSEDLPVAVVIVDSAERIDTFLPQLDELIQEGLVILDPVTVVTYTGRTPQDAA